MSGGPRRDATRAALARGVPFALAIALGTAPVPAAAQASRGDSLLAAGRVFAAESAYYDAARLAPRDPAARLALGRYLVARGATRVGSVLLEEARFFGGDVGAVARELAPAYERLGDWAALAALPSPPLGAGERRRAAWLAAHAPAREGPDEAAVAYAADATAPLGRLTLRVGGADVVATVDPTARGLVLPLAAARSARLFDAPEAPRAAGVAPVRLGALSLGSVPVTVEAAARGARVGLDFLAPLAPTFDAATGRVTVRRDGRRPAGAPGAHLALHLGRDGAAVAVGGRLVPLTGARGAAALAGARWTLDGRRGEIVVAR